MAKKQVIFSDRVVGIAIHNGLVRVDLAVFAGTTKGADDQPALALDTTHQLVLPLDAFMAATAMQDKVVQEVIAREQKRREGAAAAAPAAEEPAAATA